MKLLIAALIAGIFSVLITYYVDKLYNFSNFEFYAMLDLNFIVLMVIFIYDDMKKKDQ